MSGKSHQLPSTSSSQREGAPKFVKIGQREDTHGRAAHTFESKGEMEQSRIDVVFAMASHGREASQLVSLEPEFSNDRVVWKSGAKLHHFDKSKQLKQLMESALKMKPRRIVVFHDILLNSMTLAPHQRLDRRHLACVFTEEDLVQNLRDWTEKCAQLDVLMTVVTGSRQCLDICGSETHHRFCGRSAAKKLTTAIQDSGLPFYNGHRLSGPSCFKDGVHLTPEALQKTMIGAKKNKGKPETQQRKGKGSINKSRSKVVNNDFLCLDKMTDLEL